MQCQADCEILTISFVFAEPLVILIETRTQNYHAGSTVVLTCETNRRHSGQNAFIWFKNGVRLFPTDRYKVAVTALCAHR